MHADLTQIEEMKKNLLSELSSYMHDISAADTEEVGAVVDIIKDLTEIAKYCAEKEYYEAVTEAMDNAKYDDILGYTPSRSAGISPKPMNQMRTPGRNYESSMVGDYMRGSMGDFSQGEDSGNDRYGRAYKEYAQAKRYYTESHSEKDKAEMRTQADHHIADMLATFKDIWRDADPEHKKQMKTDLSAFVNQLAV